MKKLLIISIALMSVLFSSCSKDSDNSFVGGEDVENIVTNSVKFKCSVSEIEEYYLALDLKRKDVFVHKVYYGNVFKYPSKLKAKSENVYTSEIEGVLYTFTILNKGEGVMVSTANENYNFVKTDVDTNYLEENVDIYAKLPKGTELNVLTYTKTGERIDGVRCKYNQTLDGDNNRRLTMEFISNTKDKVISFVIKGYEHDGYLVDYVKDLKGVNLVGSIMNGEKRRVFISNYARIGNNTNFLLQRDLHKVMYLGEEGKLVERDVIYINFGGYEGYVNVDRRLNK